MYKKKSLGQHFLNAPSYLARIVDAAEIKNGDVVLEIGPGEGALTEAILRKGARVIAVEKDRRLIPILQEKLSNENFEVVEADILHFDISKCGLVSGKYKVVANIPYYITGALLKKFLSSETPPCTMTLTVQKEVAERIARSKKESILSISVKAYGEPHYIKTVPRGAFSPPPNVDSAILHIDHITHEHFTNKSEEEHFFTLLHAGFGQKRKFLKRNLESILGSETLRFMKNADIREDARAEDVGIEKWLAISKQSR